MQKRCGHIISIKVCHWDRVDLYYGPEWPYCRLVSLKSVVDEYRVDLRRSTSHTTEEDWEEHVEFARQEIDAVLGEKTRQEDGGS